MPRIIIDDATKTNPLAFLTAAKVQAISDIVAPVNEYLRVSGDDSLIVEGKIVLTVGTEGVFETVQTLLGVNDLDTGSSFSIGSDYYVYIVDNGTPNEVYKISLNSTFPAGYNADNSRKIGGFHYGVCRRVSAKLQPINIAGVERGSGWEGNIYNGILPRSVWTLSHRPKSMPEGMVYLGASKWIDIYLSSLDGAGLLQSVINELPATGTEGFHWYAFNELLAVSGKRMLTYAEFCQAALGSPPGQDGNNNNAWAATSNTARQRTGFVGPAVSSIGCRDCTGNVWEWVDELAYRYDASGSYAPGTWAWHDVVPGYGRIYQNHSRMLSALLVGGDWSDGVGAGPRAANCNVFPWHVTTGIGVRGASESL